MKQTLSGAGKILLVHPYNAVGIGEAWAAQAAPLSPPIFLKGVTKICTGPMDRTRTNGLTKTLYLSLHPKKFV